MSSSVRVDSIHSSLSGLVVIKLLSSLSEHVMMSVYTGKGLHAKDEAKLKPAIQKLMLKYVLLVTLFVSVVRHSHPLSHSLF